ncbi:hypothetical protein FKM82_008782 [Ascaphus truei]
MEQTSNNNFGRLDNYHREAGDILLHVIVALQYFLWAKNMSYYRFCSTIGIRKGNSRFCGLLINQIGNPFTAREFKCTAGLPSTSNVTRECSIGHVVHRTFSCAIFYQHFTISIFFIWKINYLVQKSSFNI